ncbi:MAG TPA: type IX secretion system protein PorQ [Chitinophagales bacterium]|nr:type IX secretion system protein PorQ [Chitinophagales bacterium]
MKRTVLFTLLVIVTAGAFAQIGGTRTYDFLSLSPSARVTALGGINITTVDYDLSMQLANPATLNPQMDKQFMVGTTVYPGGINFGNAAYATGFKKLPGTFGFGLQYIAYGKFKETDEEANVIGSFTAGEMNAYAGYGYHFGRLFSAGANFKFIYSQLATWSSVGMAADIAATVNDTAHLITASIVARNIGGELKPYNKGVREPIPFDLQAALAVGFKHVPIKLHFTFHHLYTWDIRYDNPADDVQSNLFQDSTTTKSKNYIADKLFRHVIVGAEINIKKVVRLDIAYNHLRQQELRLTTKLGIPGISFGLGIHIKQFDFTYGFQPMAQGQTLNYFTLAVNTGGFVKHHDAPVKTASY